MSYSISVAFSSKEELNKMKNFLNDQLQPLKKLILNSSLSPSFLRNWDFIVMSNDMSALTDDISFKNNSEEFVLVFNYNASDTQWEIDYLFSICYWMAIQSSKRINDRPFVLHDKHDVWELYVNESLPDNQNKVKVNQIGLEVFSLPSDLFLLTEEAKNLVLENRKKRQKINPFLEHNLYKLQDAWESLEEKV